MGMVLSHKICMIADGASDIGIETAKRITAQGGQAILCLAHDQRMPDKLQMAVDEMSCQVQTVDFTDISALQDLAEKIQTVYGRLDAMFYNKTPEVVRQRVLDISRTTVDRLIDEDITSVFLAAKVFGEFIGRQGGSMVFLSSVNAEKPTGIAASYSMYMGALRNLSREAAMFFGKKGVRSSCIELGPTGGEDKSFENDLSLFYEGYSYKIPSGYIGTAKDVAALVSFLISDESRYINGAEIRMDGGLLLQYIDAIANGNAYRRGV